MKQLTVYVPDEEYEKVIAALSYRLLRESDEQSNYTEKKALESLMKFIAASVEIFELEQHNSNFVHVPPNVIAPGAWVQPTGADTDNPPYDEGDVVLHEGQVWRSTVADNVWVPGEYGWDLL